MAAHGLEGLRKTRTFVMYLTTHFNYISVPENNSVQDMYHIMFQISTEILAAVNIKTDILGCNMDHLPNYAESLPESFGLGLYTCYKCLYLDGDFN